jgi:hypothetical protein
MRRFLTALALTISIASPATAQHAARDSALARTLKAASDTIFRDKGRPAYVERARLRTVAVSDSLLRSKPDTLRLTHTDTVVVHHTDTVYVVKPDTTKPPVPPDTTHPPVHPPVVAWTHPYAPPVAGTVFAEFPRDTVDIAYPTPTRRVKVCANACSLQAALDQAQGGDELLLPPGSVFPPLVLKDRASAGWVTIRTDISDSALGSQWTRMTRSRAAALNLATIQSTTNATPAITTLARAHHVRLVGLHITTTASMQYMLVWFGNSETVVTDLPHHITLDRDLIDVPSATDIKRCVRPDGDYMAIISSSLLNCHSNNGDSQGWLVLNARGPQRIQNNTVEGGHQAFMYGGGDPSVKNLTPCDLYIADNDFTRPASWKNVWTTKTIIEFKNGCRALIERNVARNVWASGQTGYALLLKASNQDGGCPLCTTSDVTVRDNRWRTVTSFANLAGHPEQYPVIRATRFSIYDNDVDSVNVGIATMPPGAGQGGDAFQQLGVDDVFLANNTVRNQTGRSCITWDGPPNLRLTMVANACSGQYPYNGSGAGAGSITQYAPAPSTVQNMIVPTTGAWPATLPPGVGANQARLDSLLAHVEVPQ